MMKKVYAYTESQPDQPAFVSLNDMTDGSFTLTVRSSGVYGRGVGTIELAPAQLEALAFDTLKALGYNL